MNVYTPSVLDITFNSQEEKTIEDCILVLKSIREEMTKFQCSILADSYGQIITMGEIDDILANFEILLHAVEMYD